MEKLKAFCETCNEEKDILKIIRSQNGETIELSCGHRVMNISLSDTVGVSEAIRTKHKDSRNKLLGKYQTKKAKTTGYPARETMLFDYAERILTHIVEEQFPDGEWKEVHSEKKPFKEKKEKKMDNSTEPWISITKEECPKCGATGYKIKSLDKPPDEPIRSIDGKPIYYYQCQDCMQRLSSRFRFY